MIHPIHAILIILVIVLIASGCGKHVSKGVDKITEKICGGPRWNAPPLSLEEAASSQANCKTASKLWDSSIYGGIPPDAPLTGSPYSVRPTASMNCRICNGDMRVEYPNGTAMNNLLKVGGDNATSWKQTLTPGAWRYDPKIGKGQNAISTSLVATKRSEGTCSSCKEKYTTLMDGAFTDNLSRLNKDAQYSETHAATLNKANHINKELFGIWEWDNVKSPWVENVSPWFKNTLPPCIKCKEYGYPKASNHTTNVASEDSSDMLCYSHISGDGNNVISTCSAETQLLKKV